MFNEVLISAPVTGLQGAEEAQGSSGSIVRETSDWERAGGGSSEEEVLSRGPQVASPQGMHVQTKVASVCPPSAAILSFRQSKRGRPGSASIRDLRSGCHALLGQ